MKLLIGYATKEGQTRKIARYLADWAADHGHAVELLAVAEADDLDVDRFDAALLAAPVHAGHYPNAFADFAHAHAAWLNGTDTRFVSVSLAAAGHEADDWRDLDKIADDLCAATGWSPKETVHVAGAYRPSRYDILTGFIMRRILAKKDPGTDPRADKEYTDWRALGAWAHHWLGA